MLVTLAASHHDLDLDVLEQLSSEPDVMGQAVLSACPQVRGVVVLATCNRFELYLDIEASDPSGEPAGEITLHRAVETVRSEVAQVVAAAGGLGIAEVRTELRVRADPVAHLFAVASGLDSMVVGEREISGQVRRALVGAKSARTTSTALHRVFEMASRTSRTVANRTGFGAAGRSVVGVALDLAEPTLPPWSDVRCVLVGTGSYAGAALAALHARGCRDVWVYSASGRAEEFAAPRGARPLTEDDVASALTGVDLVVACSGAAGPVLDAERLGLAREQRPPGDAPRTLTVVDLALRHDVSPDVAELPGVHLVTLHTVAAEAPHASGVPVAQAMTIVRDAAAEFTAQLRVREWGLAVVAERARVLAGLDREGRRRAHEVMHDPTMRAHAAARAGDRRGFADALAELEKL